MRRRSTVCLNKNYVQAGHSILAHSRPDKIGTPRLLPLYIRNIFNGLSAKNPLKYYALPFLFEFVSNVHFRLVGFAEAKRYRKIIFYKHLHYVNAFLGLKILKVV